MAKGAGNQLRMRSFRWKYDTSPVTADSDWAGNLNARLFAAAGRIIRVRMHIDRQNPSLQLNTQFGLWYEKDGEPDVRITPSSTNLQVIASSQYANHSPCLNLFLSSGTIINSNNGMHLSGGQATIVFTFPAAPRRFESEWALFAVPGEAEPGAEFTLTMKRENGTEFELSPFQRPRLTIVESGFCLEGRLDSAPLASGLVRADPTLQGRVEGSALMQGQVSSALSLEGRLEAKTLSPGDLKSCGSS